MIVWNRSFPPYSSEAQGLEFRDYSPILPSCLEIWLQGKEVAKPSELAKVPGHGGPRDHPGIPTKQVAGDNGRLAAGAGHLDGGQPEPTFSQ